MPLTRVNMSIEDLADFSRVVEEARERGLRVEQEMPEIGVVSGSIDASKLRDLESLRGVAAVEPVREVRIPPPEETIE